MDFLILLYCQKNEKFLKIYLAKRIFFNLLLSYVSFMKKDINFNVTKFLNAFYIDIFIFI